MPRFSQNPDRAEYIAGLRQLADWLEQNPETAVPQVADILLALMTNEAVEAHAAAGGLEVRYDREGNASAVSQFGSVTYRGYGYADWDQHIAQHEASRAHDWADKNDMVIQPREGGAS